MQWLWEKIRQIIRKEDSFSPCCFVQSIAGNRPENQDNYLLIIPENGKIRAQLLEQEKPIEIPLTQWPANMLRLAVADGMGGHMQGREIAEMAVRELSTLSPVYSPLQMRQTIYTLHERLQKHFLQQGKKSPGTTLIVVDIDRDSGRGILASLGDSRAWKFAENGFSRLTWDHSAIEFDYREGLFGEKEYHQLSLLQTHKLAQALGNGSFGVIKDAAGRRHPGSDPHISLELPGEQKEGLPAHPDIIELNLLEGEALLLATDGLWNGLSHAVWPGPCGSEFVSQEEVERQVQKALAQGSNDNVTVIIYGQHLQEKK